jgi:hypothetical protein
MRSWRDTFMKSVKYILQRDCKSSWWQDMDGKWAGKGSIFSFILPL